MNGKIWILSTVLLTSSAVGAAQAQVAGTSNPGNAKNAAAYVSPDNLREIERVLQTQGFNPGKVDGVMDQEMVNALRAFQQREGLRATGVLNPATVKQLVGKGAAISPSLRDSKARESAAAQ
jgi:peptidoglycan hydrolase-like protein with peptidoglycan-binding domain